LNVDEEIVLWLNQWAGRSSILDGVVKLLASDYLVPGAIGLCLVAIWFVGNGERREAHQRAVIRSLAAVGFASLVVLILDQHYFRARPFVEHDLTLLLYPPTDSSFPSHPAAVGFALAAGVWGGNRRLGAVVYGVAALWGLSRVFAGVFYPSDVLAGAAIGVAISHLVALALRLIEPVPTLVLRATRMLHLA
jgi:undecaprenyl-diphosphatase